jgi:hypothetical protein
LEVTMTRQTNKNKFWNWKCHISMKNRTLKLNKVSLESSSILLLCNECAISNKGASGILQGETIVPWLHNQTRKNFVTESSISLWTIGPKSW